MLTKIIDYMKKNGLEGFFISSPINVKYISKYTSDDAYLFITENKYYFLTDPRYTEQASLECPDYQIINWRSKGKSIGEVVVKLADSLNLKNFAFEGNYLNFNEYKEFSKIKIESIGVTGVVEELRAVKKPDEVQKIRAACEINDRAFKRIIKDIKIGVTEKELASKLSHYMVVEGADTKPYGNILISGKRTSLLHGIPSNKVIEYGDFVLMDYGCAYKGYLSDMTRTVVVGKPSDEQKKVYNLSKKMTEDTLKKVKAGVSAAELYKTSIEAIKDTEYFKYHYSGIGHGIGMFVHESPSINPNSKAVLEENNIITIEPGLYIPGWGGVRIEDQVLVSKDGKELLTNSTRELIEL